MPVDELVSELLVVQKTIVPLECQARGYGLVGILRWRIPNLQFLGRGGRMWPSWIPSDSPCLADLKCAAFISCVVPLNILCTWLAAKESRCFRN